MHSSFEEGFEKTAFVGLIAKGVKNIATRFAKGMVKGTGNAVKTVSTKALKNPIKTTIIGSIGADVAGQTKGHMSKTVSPRLNSRYVGV